MRKPIPFAIVVALGLALDLLTKKLAFDKLSPNESYSLIPDVLQLVHAENHGVAFSMLASYPSVILVVTSLAIIFLIWLYARVRLRANRVALVSIALLLIGATGNLIDRVIFHYVRDFIDFMPQLPLIGHWAVFNVADICITTGVILYAVNEIFFAKTPRDEEAA
ncbi:MAG TPA: signal peptidase II [Planctomycetota bacterium]|nr:signal peptidase II [Planctomycetota bacterium]